MTLEDPEEADCTEPSRGNSRKPGKGSGWGGEGCRETRVPGAR